MRHLGQYNKQVAHITSPAADLHLVKQQRSDVFTIGWVGGYAWGHRNGLHTFVLPAIKQLDFPVRLVLLGLTSEEHKQEIGTYFLDAEHVAVEMPLHIDWRDELALQQRIMQFDVGVATLENTAYHLAKSGIKAKQYLTCGVPVICNNLPENTNVVKHGINGFVCETWQEFAQRFREINKMGALAYKALSSAARASLPNFDHAHYWEKWAALYDAQEHGSASKQAKTAGQQAKPD